MYSKTIVCIEELERRVSERDGARSIFLGVDLKTAYNVLCREDGSPHTLESISKKLRMSNSTTRKFIDRLKYSGILYQGKLWDDGNPFPNRVVYMLNPYLIRKDSEIALYLTTLFDL